MKKTSELKSRRNVGPISCNRYQFEAPPRFGGLLVSEFEHLETAPAFYLARHEYTIHIDLGKTMESIFQDFRQNVRREIRQGESLPFVYKTNGSADDFAPFFDSFADGKGITRYDPSENVSITSMGIDERVTSYHAYTVDPGTKIVRLRHSATSLHEGKELGKTIGLLNKLHHYLDMAHFKESGFRTYDWGGAQNPLEEPKTSLHTFKSGFGGTSVDDYSGKSLGLVLLEAFLGSLKKTLALVSPRATSK